jgi:hypothetical protein
MRSMQGNIISFPNPAPEALADCFPTISLEELPEHLCVSGGWAVLALHVVGSACGQERIQ